MPTESAPHITARAPKKMITMRSSPNRKVLAIVKIRSILLHAQLGADPVDQVVVPHRLPPVADRQRLDARHAAQRFEEMRVFVGRVDDRLLVRPAVEAVGEAAHQRVDAGHADRQHGEPRIVKPHHAQQRERHHAIDHRGDRARCTASAGSCRSS